MFQGFRVQGLSPVQNKFKPSTTGSKPHSMFLANALEPSCHLYKA